MITRVSICIAATLLLTGCVDPTVKDFKTPSGITANKVKCNVDVNKCFQAATDSCDGGAYQVLSSESHAGGMLADWLPGPVTWYSMTYVCGESDGKMPAFGFQGQEYHAPPVVVQPAPAQIKSPTTTNCYMVGNTLQCQSF